MARKIQRLPSETQAVIEKDNRAVPATLHQKQIQRRNKATNVDREILVTAGQEASATISIHREPVAPAGDKKA